MHKSILTLLAVLLVIGYARSQASVGIGTNTPNPKAILDLQSTNQVLLLPRMTSEQMDAIASPPVGSLIYNNDLRRLMNYTTTHINRINLNGNIITIASNKWLPVSAGPKVLAWGSVDSSTGSGSAIIVPINAGSGNFTVRWYKEKNGSTTNWYELSLTGDSFDPDSMILNITPVGNGSWDVAVSTGEVINGSTSSATIKFTDISRSVAGWAVADLRRRSSFHFVLYDMRGF